MMWRMPLKTLSDPDRRFDCSGRHAMLRAVIVIVFALLTANVFAVPPTIEEVHQALDIAEMAATNGLTDLSKSALRRALQAGPPTVSTATPPPTIQQYGARIDTTRPAPTPPIAAILERIPGTIRKLTVLWQPHLDATQIYAALKPVVLPPQRPDEIFLYVSPPAFDANDSSRVPRVDSVAVELINWAKASGRIDELVASIEARKLEHSIEAQLVLLQCAIASENQDAITNYSTGIGRAIASGTSLSNVQLATALGVQLQLRGDSPEGTADILTAAAETGMTIARFSDVARTNSLAMTLAAVRSCFAAGRNDHAVNLLKTCLEAVDTTSSENSGDGAASRVRSIVARELYGRGLIIEARELLGRSSAAEFEGRLRNESLTLAANTKPLLQTAQRFSTKAQAGPATEDAKKIWICSLPTDTNQSKVLFTLPDFQNVSYPVLSPDGRQLAFAATFPGEVVTSSSRLFVVQTDGSNLRELGLGTLPSWSPSGRRLVCSRYSPNRGVWVVRVDDGGFQLLDDAGWSGRWSPDGLKIAYIRPTRGGTEFLIKNLAEDRTTRIAEGRRTTTAQSTWNFGWTPNSARLFVEAKGEIHAETFALASISVTSAAEKSDLTNAAEYYNVDLAVHPQDTRVLIAPKLPRYGSERLHFLNYGTAGSLKYVAGQFENRRNSGASWMSDGRTIIYLSRPERP